MAEQYQRVIFFENIFNFRDLGGYKARNGKTVAWKRLYRSGELRLMTQSDLQKLQREIKLAAVIDLRSNFEITNQSVGLLAQSDIKYHNVALISDGGNREANIQRYKNHTSMGQFYAQLVCQKEFGNKIVNALEIMTIPENHPLIFHCSAGKDRTGILTAILLYALGVTGEDIQRDYCLSAPYVASIVSLMKNQPELAEKNSDLPGYFWEISPDSVTLLLAKIQKEFGGAAGYLKTHGAEKNLIERLEKALLV